MRLLGCGIRVWRWWLLLAVVILPTRDAAAQFVNPDLWATDGAVRTMARAGNTLYIGGSFNYVAPSTGNLCVFRRSDGSTVPGFPRVDGNVRAIISDGAGGWYIGGSFRKVGGVARNRLAHILADMTVDSWNPNPNGLVQALAILDSSRILVGGQFTSIAGLSRQRFAAIDRNTGAGANWFPSGIADGEVFAIRVHGSRVYVGGWFTSIGGTARNHLAALNASTGQVLPWNPNPNSTVFCIVPMPSRLYIGGGFTSIGTDPRIGVAELDSATGIATNWSATAPQVRAMIVTGSQVMAAGAGLKVIDRTTGQIVSSAYSGYTIPALVLAGSTSYFGGSGGSIGQYLLTSSDGAWNPLVRGGVYALAATDTTVLVGGDYAIVGGMRRNNLAALNVSSGQATTWDPNVGGPVNSLSLVGSNVYVGGTFSTIGGVTRTCLAALDLSTGTPTSWNPTLTGSNSISSLAVRDTLVYASGIWSANRFRAFHISTGLPTSWNPGSDGVVNQIITTDSSLFVTGGFTVIGNRGRRGLAEILRTTGLATNWNPDPDQSAHTIALEDSTLYVGGSFLNIGAPRVQRSYMAAVNTRTGEALPWISQANNFVQEIELTPSKLYVGGDFSVIGLATRIGLAEIDRASGNATSWDPGLHRTPASLLASSNFLYVGSAGTRDWDLSAHPGLEAVTIGTWAPPTVTVTAPAPGETLVVGSVRTLEWTATAAQPGVQAVDLYVSRTGAGGPWELIAMGLDNTGEFGWTVTGPGASDCFLRVDAHDLANGTGSDVNNAAFVIYEPAVTQVGNALPEFALSPLAPNPSNGRGMIRFAISRRDRVRLSLFDLQGREILLLADGLSEAGRHEIPLEAAHLRPGLYLLRLSLSGADATRRVVIVR